MDPAPLTESADDLQNDGVEETLEAHDNVTVTIDEGNDLMISINHDITLPRPSPAISPFIDVVSLTALSPLPGQTDPLNESADQLLLHNTGQDNIGANLEQSAAAEVYEGTIFNEGHSEFSHILEDQTTISDPTQTAPVLDNVGSAILLGNNEGTITEDVSMPGHATPAPNMTLFESLIMTAFMMRTYMRIRGDAPEMEFFRRFVTAVEEIIERNNLLPLPLDLSSAEIMLDTLKMVLADFEDEDVNESSAQLDVTILKDE